MLNIEDIDLEHFIWFIETENGTPISVQKLVSFEVEEAIHKTSFIVMRPSRLFIILI